MPSNGWWLSPIISRQLARSPPRPLQTISFLNKLFLWSASLQDFKLPSNPNPSPTALLKLSRSIVLLNHCQAIQAISLVCAKSPKKKAGVVEQHTRGLIEDDFAVIAMTPILTVTTAATKTPIAMAVAPGSPSQPATHSAVAVAGLPYAFIFGLRCVVILHCLLCTYQILYCFKTGQNKTVAHNCKIKNSTFAFEYVKEKMGLYKIMIFQMAVNARSLWFAKRKDDGPHHPHLVGPGPRFGCT
ncbi:hypothetical protein DFH07DRAFT_957300 [Mycena maculata]|uniref:Uncharacterized protein n=1 Tax=Mycena maculata TaxID=230809 RepID=A0AAD7JDU1_9AGAR|nr:hypothetical protein DFH07DRAFT_957300 [Mycena maculata]